MHTHIYQLLLYYLPFNLLFYVLFTDAPFEMSAVVSTFYKDDIMQLMQLSARDVK